MAVPGLPLLLPYMDHTRVDYYYYYSIYYIDYSMVDYYTTMLYYYMVLLSGGLLLDEVALLLGYTTTRPYTLQERDHVDPSRIVVI